MDLMAGGKKRGGIRFGGGENRLVATTDANNQLAMIGIELGKNVVEEKNRFLGIGTFKIIDLTKAEGKNCQTLLAATAPESEIFVGGRKNRVVETEIITMDTGLGVTQGKIERIIAVEDSMSENGGAIVERKGANFFKIVADKKSVDRLDETKTIFVDKIGVFDERLVPVKKL